MPPLRPPPSAVPVQDSHPPEPAIDESRCKTCNLGEELLAQIRELRFRSDYSNARIAGEINRELSKKGWKTRLSAKNLSDHFRHHGTQDDRARYALQSVRNGARRISLGGPKGEALALLRDERIQNLRGRVAYVGHRLADEFDGSLSNIHEYRLMVGSDRSSRAYDTLNKLGRGVLAAAETQSKLGHPDLVGAVISEVILDALVEDVATTVSRTVQSLAEVVLPSVAEANRASVDAQLREGVSNLASELRVLADGYREEIGSVLNAPIDGQR